MDILNHRLGDIYNMTLHGNVFHCFWKIKEIQQDLDLFLEYLTNAFFYYTL